MLRMRNILTVLCTLALSLTAFAANEKNYTYLALGDSVAYGYITDRVAPPETFVGYPEIVASALHLLKSGKEVNASCPGQSSFTFLYGGLDIGCDGIRSTIGLHTNYTGTQANFAVSQLLSNKHISLVTLNIGGNDLSLLQQYCAKGDPVLFAGCIETGIKGVLTEYARNLTKIFTAIRVSGGYAGTLVLLTQYSPSGNPLFVNAVGALNQYAASIGTAFGARIADGFTAFLNASVPFGGDPCAAGLLVRTSANSCDIHPSPLGRDLLAATVLRAIEDAPKH